MHDEETAAAPHPHTIHSRREDDPMVHNKVAARLVRFLLDVVELVRGRSPSWTVPTLHLWAGADRCVSPPAAPPPPHRPTWCAPRAPRPLPRDPQPARAGRGSGRDPAVTRPPRSLTGGLCRGHRPRAQDVRRRAGRAAPPARRRGGERRPVARGGEEPEGDKGRQALPRGRRRPHPRLGRRRDGAAGGRRDRRFGGHPGNSAGGHGQPPGPQPGHPDRPRGGAGRRPPWGRDGTSTWG